MRDLRELHPLGAPDYRSENYFWAFLLLHLYLYAHAFAHADVSLDVTRLARDAGYRDAIRKQIRRQTSHTLDLDSFQSNFALCLSVPHDLIEFRERLEASMQLVYSVLEPKKKHARNIEKVVNDLLEEMDRHKFYAGGVTGIVCRPMGLLDLRDRGSAMENAHDALAAQQAGLIAERGSLAGERDALMDERNVLREELGARKTERDELLAQRDALHRCEEVLCI